MQMRDGLVLSCEHARNRVPARYASRFEGARRVLASHRGYDIGALEIARHLARQLGAPLFTGRVTRLVVDLNRSPGHRHLFSPYVSNLTPSERQRVIDRHYRPYREAVEAALAERMAGRGHVLHLALHSFTPVLRGRRRKADLGLLYDAKRTAERRLALRWQSILQELGPELRVRRNYPYRGIDDGFIPFLRKRFPARRYLGLELEVNQRLLRSASGIRQMASVLVESLRLLEPEGRP